MARINGTPRPKNLKKTLKAMASYLTRHIGTLIIIAILVLISAGANILGTYLLKPVINDYILPGNNAGLLQAIITMAIDRDGSIILKYSKVHTCDFDLERYLESGKEFKVCHFDGICIGVMICYDREYPESARELMMQGAELILVPNDCDCVRPFRLRELSVEAMQNMVGIAMANPPGKNSGCSCAFHPMVWGHQENSIIVADEELIDLVWSWDRTLNELSNDWNFQRRKGCGKNYGSH